MRNIPFLSQCKLRLHHQITDWCAQLSCAMSDEKSDSFRNAPSGAIKHIIELLHGLRRFPAEPDRDLDADRAVYGHGGNQTGHFP